MRGAMLSRAAWISVFLLLTCRADAGQVQYGDDSGAAWIGALLQEQWMLLDPVLGASMLAGTMLAGWNSHLRRQIARRQRREHALQAAARSAESACRAKSDFLAIASHEIRTPLHAVAGMLELGLQEAAAGQDVQDHLRVAHGAAQGLLDLVRDILDLDKMDRGKLELLPQRANLRVLAESAVQLFHGMARDKGLALRFEVDQDADADVMVDAMRFRQILSNLLSNAVKFTETGHVAVSLRARRTGVGRLAATVTVTDTGMGISTADQQKLFAPYTQTREGARVHGGSGLGLSIARRLAALMGGTLRLQSAPGQGCTVSFDFDAEILPAPAGALDACRPGMGTDAPLQILAVDDNAPSRVLLRKQLEHLGHRVVQANSGKAGWRLWRAGAYDVVITDCNMAGGSGYALARRIREAEAAQGTGPCTVWAYTASARQDETDRCMEAGMDACLFKPLGLAALQQRLCGLRQGPARLRAAWRQGLRFDPGAIESLAAGDGAIADRFLQALSETSEQDAAALSDALAAADGSAASEVLHAVNGVARMIGATPLADACVAAQHALARDGFAASAHACHAAQQELALLTRSVRAWTEPPHGAAPRGRLALQA
ncbi:ATP-binding protein [Bordetella sp. H567]|uniref:ATP-binding protein n=1 Tax=Bordetella sp. H567 TaxID=1697043 RepID=UPI0008361D04|nr:ATP-binding protein [Bordetella sp. H567]